MALRTVKLASVLLFHVVERKKLSGHGSMQLQQQTVALVILLGEAREVVYSPIICEAAVQRTYLDVGSVRKLQAK